MKNFNYHCHKQKHHQKHLLLKKQIILTISFPFNATNLNSIEEVSEPSAEPSAEAAAEPAVEPAEETAAEPSTLPNVDIVDVDINLNKLVEVENMINEVENVDLSNIDINISNFDENTLEEYSNEQSDVQIYSNDNEEEHHTSLMESMVEAVDGNNTSQLHLDTLLKNNKLPEIQQMAENLSIDIHKENSKKKTKLELATDILNHKK